MRYRILKNTKGSEVWYTIQVKVHWWMWWHYLTTYPDGFQEVTEWETYDEARRVVDDLIRAHQTPEKEVVYDTRR